MKILFSVILIFLSIHLPGQYKKEATLPFKINKSKKMELITFDSNPSIGYVRELKEDSISMMLINEEYNIVPVENIHLLKFKQKSDRRFSYAVIGSLIGAVPGVIYVSTFEKRVNNLVDVFVAPADIAIGISMALGGSILGGAIGYHLGNKNGTITIPINGNQTLYQKQKENIKKLAF
jgi:hypothetical protein